MRLIGYFFGVKLYADTDTDATTADLAARLATAINPPAQTTDLGIEAIPAFPDDVREDLAAAMRMVADCAPAEDIEALRAEFRRVTAQRLLAAYLRLLPDAFEPALPDLDPMF